MTDQIDFVALVDAALEHLEPKGLRILPLTICHGLSSMFLSDAMSAEDRARVLVEIIVTVNHRVISFKRRQSRETRWLA